MTASAEWLKQPDLLALAGEVDFNNVVALLQDGEMWLKNSAESKCLLDFAGVTYSNSAGVALIMGLHRHAQTLNKHLTITHVPDNLLSMARLGGLDWLLEMPQEEVQNHAGKQPAT